MSEQFTFRSGLQRFNCSFRRMTNGILDSVRETRIWRNTERGASEIDLGIMLPDVQNENTFPHLNSLINYCRASFSYEGLKQFPMNPMGRTTGQEKDWCDSGILSRQNSQISISPESIDECVLEFKRQQSNDSNFSSKSEVIKEEKQPGEYIRKVSIVSTVTRISTVILGTSENTMALAEGESRTHRLSNEESVPVTTGNSNGEVTLQHVRNNCTNVYDDTFFNATPCLKLSLQYFSNGSQLRVLLLKARDLGVLTGHIISKCTLFRDDRREKSKSLKRVPATNNAKINQEVLFDDVQLEKEAKWSLRIRLYYKRHFISKKRCLGETMMALDGLDLFMNTTLWCLLKSKRASVKGVNPDSDFRLFSRDRSIRAHAKASLSSSNLFSVNSSSSSLHLSRSDLRRVNTIPISRKSAQQNH